MWPETGWEWELGVILMRERLWQEARVQGRELELAEQKNYMSEAFCSGCRLKLNARLAMSVEILTKLGPDLYLYEN